MVTYIKDSFTGLPLLQNFRKLINHELISSTVFREAGKIDVEDKDLKKAGTLYGLIDSLPAEDNAVQDMVR